MLGCMYTSFACAGNVWPINTSLAVSVLFSLSFCFEIRKVKTSCLLANYFLLVFYIGHNSILKQIECLKQKISLPYNLKNSLIWLLNQRKVIIMPVSFNWIVSLIYLYDCLEQDELLCVLFDCAGMYVCSAQLPRV